MRKKKSKQTLTTIGKRVAQLRKERSVTQEQLAEKAGLDRMTIAFIENGLRWPRQKTVEKLAKALRVSVDDLFRP